MKLWKNFIGIICFLHFFYYRHTECQELYKNFTIFWAIPTFLCRRYGINFDEFFRNVSLARNSEKLSKSNAIVTFNNPELLGNQLPEKMNKISYVSLQKADIRSKIFSTFKGLGVLNYTLWEPIFRQNIGPLEYFYNSSIEMEKKLYPLLDEKQTLELATMRFEFATSIILGDTIKNIKNIWPLATWGLFDHPKCSSQPNEKLPPECDQEIMEDNDKLSWLWDLNIGLFPLISISLTGNIAKKQRFVEARLREAKRISEKYDPPLKIYPYLRLRYNDYDKLIPRTVLISILKIFLNIQTDGLILWEDENDLYNYVTCHDYYQLSEYYLRDVFNEFLELMRKKNKT